MLWELDAFGISRKSSGLGGGFIAIEIAV